MVKYDLRVFENSVKQKPEYTCMLSGDPCELVPVKLRRMIIFPPIWIGWNAVVYLPLAKAPPLVFWQYFRMLRPYVVLISLSLITFSITGFGRALGVKPSGPVASAMAFITPAVPIAIWVLLGKFIQRFEFVRLIRRDSSTGTVTIRFSKQCYAERASEILVISVPESKVVS
jgi:hypothetical protein